MRRTLFVFLSAWVIILFLVPFESGWSAGFYPETTKPSNINLQIQAIEITQGVRGDIPSRNVPDDDLTILPDGAVHVANRRTVVRVYPWVDGNPEKAIQPVTARLWAYRDGILLASTPLSPQNDLLSISSSWDLETMRRDANKSWNFILLDAWCASKPGSDSFTLRFVVEVNPPGTEQVPECPDCYNDNWVILGGQDFVTVPPLVIQPYFVEHTVMDRDGSQITYSGPTQDEFDGIMQMVHSMLPVGDFARGFNILPPIAVRWQGLLYEKERHIFAEAMIDKYLPGGSMKGNQGGTIHLFIFSSDGKHNFLVNYNQDGVRLPQAWTGWPFAQSGARGLELVHELTHCIGLSHAGNAYGETTFNPDYPDPSGQVEPNAYGFDIWEMQAIPPISEKGKTHDFMSYNSLDPAWVSIYTWKAVSSLLGQLDLDI